MSFGRGFKSGWSFNTAEFDKHRKRYKSITAQSMAVNEQYVVTSGGKLEIRLRDEQGFAGEVKAESPGYGRRKSWNGHRVTDACVISNDMAYVATACPALRVHSLTDGSEIAVIDLPKRVQRHSAAIAHNKLYLTLVDGSILALGQ